MNIIQQNRALIVTEVRKYIELATKLYGYDFDMPHVRFDLRGTRGGWAKQVSWELNFNEALMLDNMNDYITNTVPHEVAHLVDGKLFRDDTPGIVYTRSGRPRRAKRDIHGASWKRVMSAFGVQAENITRCHEMDTSKVKRSKTVTRFEYKCECGYVGQIGHKHHKAIQYKNALVTWKYCKHRIKREHFVVAKVVQ